MSNIANIRSIFDRDVFKYDLEEKDKCLLDFIRSTSNHHYKNNILIKSIFDSYDLNPSEIEISNLPYLTSSIFKSDLLLSINEKNIFREINSSSTSSGSPSRIGLDKFNNENWSISLKKILLSRLGNKKFSILFLDTDNFLSKDSVINARNSMSKSFLFLANNFETCLKQRSTDILEIDMHKVKNFFHNNKNSEILIFGFTYILYKYFLSKFHDNQFKDLKITIVHAGGWKKLNSEKVSNDQLIDRCNKIFNLNQEDVIDLYGFSEQGGILYPDCSHGRKHLPFWSDLLVRDPKTLEISKNEKPGLLQFITPIQTSYPGFSILTEDIGYVFNDKCKCGLTSKSFKVIGRSQNETEQRGCGDIMSSKF